MIQRNLYIKQVLPFIDKPFIKVITGLRRSGKSVLLQLIRKELVARNIQEENIIYLNFESFELSEITNAEKLFQLIKSKITNKAKYYILLDEIQEVKSWEKVVNACTIDFNTDIYITGSNSNLLSSELATYLAGRYIEIKMFTLSFSEYLDFKRNTEETKNIYDHFNNFVRMGGFPAIHTAEYESETAYKIIYDIYSSAILRDTIQHNNIRDVELLERVVKFVFDNVGNKFSAKNITDYFKSQFRKVDINTIYNYLNALENAFIIYRIQRYDIKGKEILKTNEKYFTGDQSMIYAVMGVKDRHISGVLENIVMLEFKRRGYRVFVGKFNDLEVDFVAEKADEKIYCQVTYKITDETVVNREFGPLLKIDDNYPKYVISTEQNWTDNINGVKHLHIADFLLAKNW